MEERYIAAIDLGSHKIAISVAEVNGQNVQFIYYNDIPSKGVLYSGVLNPRKVSEQVKELITKAENDLKINILQAAINLPRWEVRQENAKACLTRSDSESPIEQEEIDFLKTESRSYPLANEKNEDIYGVIAQSFATEDFINADESDIVGMVSESLEGNFKAYVGKRRQSRNAGLVMNTLGKATTEKIFTPEHTAKAVLSEEEMANGVALIEMGGDVTSVSVFSKGILRYYSSIPFGGRSITDDVRLECGISEKLAENIKLAYGVCMPEKLQVLRDKIIQIDNNDSGTSKQLSVKYLSEIITARLNEIVQAALYMIQQSGYADSLISGVVLTGGVAQTVNLATYVKELSGYDVRIGYPLRCRFSYSECPEITDTSASTLVGMVLHTMENEQLNCLTVKEKEPETIIEEEEVAEEPMSDQDRIREWFTQPQATEAPAEEVTEVPVEPTPEAPVEEPYEEEVEVEEEVREEKKKEKKPRRESKVGRFGKLLWEKVTKAGDAVYGFTEDND